MPNAAARGAKSPPLSASACGSLKPSLVGGERSRSGGMLTAGTARRGRNPGRRRVPDGVAFRRRLHVLPVPTMAAWERWRGVRVRDLVGVIAQIRVELPVTGQVDATRRHRTQPLRGATCDPGRSQTPRQTESTIWTCACSLCVALGALETCRLRPMPQLEFSVSTAAKCRLKLTRAKASASLTVCYNHGRPDDRSSPSRHCR